MAINMYALNEVGLLSAFSDYMRQGYQDIAAMKISNGDWVIAYAGDADDNYNNTSFKSLVVFKTHINNGVVFVTATRQGGVASRDYVFTL